MIQFRINKQRVGNKRFSTTISNLSSNNANKTRKSQLNLIYSSLIAIFLIMIFFLPKWICVLMLVESPSSNFITAKKIIDLIQQLFFKTSLIAIFTIKPITLELKAILRCIKKVPARFTNQSNFS